MSDNLFSQFRRLVAGPPRLYGEVVATAGDLATIQLPDGSLVQALGTASIGQRVFLRAGVVEASAPALPVVTLVL